MGRRLAVGAECLPEGGVHFRVWAPSIRRIELVIDGGRATTVDLNPDGRGYHAGLVDSAGPGTRYRYRLDGGEPRPDPASRSQPDGPHGPSMVVDPAAFDWTDRAWRGVRREGQVLYELHVGTFTPEGTWRSASDHLPALAEIGITLLEILPVAEFPGRFNWGYDGVNLFAPARAYGAPDDFRRFVDRAHGLGLGVLLDVVYNHLGPDGNYLKEFAAAYFSDEHPSEWGTSFNFDGIDSGPVREFFLANAGYWVDEYHLDGLRIDAAQAIVDRSPEHILAAIGRRVRAAARGRSTLVIAENEPQSTTYIRPTGQGGYGLDAVWNEDFHHSAMVALNGRRDSYQVDYRGAPQEFISAMKRGFLYQGQRYLWQSKRRGQPTAGLAPSAFVIYLQNHDQVANTFGGRRFHQLASPGCYRAMTALFLLAPSTPMLFQGQEFAASSPFLYFGDLKPETADAMLAGRRKSLKQSRSFHDPAAEALIDDPADPTTFERSKLDPAERVRNTEAVALHRDLLRMRRKDPVFHDQGAGRLDGAVLGAEAFVLRYFGEDGDDRLLLVNFGADLAYSPAPEPLLAPPEGGAWEVIWNSEDPRYGGGGIAAVETQQHWWIPGQAAVALAPRPLEAQPDAEPHPVPDALEGRRRD